MQMNLYYCLHLPTLSTARHVDLNVFCSFSVERSDPPKHPTQTSGNGLVALLLVPSIRFFIALQMFLFE